VSLWYRPALLALDQQVGALTIELEKAAPAALPKGMGAMSSVVISREICDWQRFKNRRQLSSYTGLCPGEYIGDDGNDFHSGSNLQSDLGVYRSLDNLHHSAFEYIPCAETFRCHQLLGNLSTPD
jgi:hypothetical protein